MIDIDNQSTFDFKKELCEDILKSLSDKSIELIICDNDYIQNLNKEHRQKDQATDVLSFPLEFDFPNMPLGSIVISYDFVKEKATLYNHTQEQEFALLFIHGLLHLLNYDHEVDDGEHRQKEEELIKEFNLPNSLIVRNQ